MKAALLLRRWALGVAAGAAGLVAGCSGGSSTTSITVDEKELIVEVANSEASQKKGLMGRKAVPEGSGMVFIFEKPIRVCMWMKDTPAALSVGFFDEQGRLLQVEDLHPFSEKLRCARSPVRYAVEVRQGWFARQGVNVGAQLKGNVAGLQSR